MATKHVLHSRRRRTKRWSIHFLCVFVTCIIHNCCPVRSFSNTLLTKRSTCCCAPSYNNVVLKASSSIDDVPNDAKGSRGSNTSKKKRYNRRNLLRLRQKQPYYYNQPPSIQSATHKNSNKEYDKQRNGNEEEHVPNWLLESTSHILGDALTFQIINGGDKDIKQIQHNNDLDTNEEEFVQHAESTMRAWCQWIVRCSNGNSGSRSGGSKKHQLIHGDIQCTALNAARVVDTIMHRVMNVTDNSKVGECDNSLLGDTKLIELVNVAIDAWASSKNRDGTAVHCAEGWLQLLQQRLSHLQNNTMSSGVKLGYDDMRLYEESYRGVIRTCIYSHDYQHLQKALGLLDEMNMQKNDISLADYGEQVLCPTAQTCNLVLYGLANCEPCVENAKQAESILNDMIERQRNGASYAYRPDSNTFRQVITSWTKSDTTDVAAMNARRILDQMLSDFPKLDPDASTFNALMTLYLQLGRRKETLSVFDLMCSLQRSGRKGTTPDVYSVNLMLNAMSKQPPFCSLEELQKAEDVLDVIREMFNVAPDVQSYNILIDSWARSRLKEAANRAELLLDIMERRCRLEPRLAPDGYTYTSTINAIQRSKHHEARGSWAENVFHRMEVMHSQGLVERPTTPVYDALLNCIVTSGENGSLDRAEALFADIEKASLANTRTCNTMLKGYSIMSRSSDGKTVYPTPHGTFLLWNNDDLDSR